VHAAQHAFTSAVFFSLYSFSTVSCPGCTVHALRTHERARSHIHAQRASLVENANGATCKDVISFVTFDLSNA
jgi:hypothetical protein